MISNRPVTASFPLGSTPTLNVASPRITSESPAIGSIRIRSRDSLLTSTFAVRSMDECLVPVVSRALPVGGFLRDIIGFEGFLTSRNLTIPKRCCTSVSDSGRTKARSVPLSSCACIRMIGFAASPTTEISLSRNTVP